MMPLRIIVAVSMILVFGDSVRAQSVLVCTLDTEQAVVKQNESGGLTTEVVKGQADTMIFANFDTAKPVLKIGPLEIQLELLHADGDTFWLRGFTPDFIGSGIVIWMVDRKSRVVIRSETFKTIEAPKSLRKVIGVSSIGKCQ
jgi:hypothetical protein